MDIRFYLSLFLRRLPYFLLVLAAGSAIGITLAVALPPVFRSQAVLIVESQQIPSDLAASTVRTEATEQLQIIQQRILTRDRLLEMANRLRIYDERADRSVGRMDSDEKVEDLRRRISIETTGGTDTPRSMAQATIVRVGFSAPSPAMSAAVTNEVVTLILQENVAIRTNVAAQTLDFFQEEVARLDRELSARGAEILAFQEGNLDSLPDSLEFRRTQQAAAQERLQQISREEATLRDRRQRLVTLYETNGQIEPMSLAGPQSAEQRQLQSMRDELAGLLAVLSPTNPRVTVLEARIKAMEQRVAAAGAENGSGSLEGLSPFEIQLADLDAQLDFLAEQKSQIEDQMKDLEASIAATPGNAIKLETLQRDYAALRAQYDQAVANRAQAETGDTIEALAKGQRITVVEQAIAPREPESPNRLLVASAGIGGGMVFGIALVVLLEVMNQAIRRPSELTSRLGIMAFATIPMIRTHADIMRRRMIMGLAFLAVLVIVPTGLWLIHSQVTPLDLLFERALESLTFAGHLAGRFA